MKLFAFADVEKSLKLLRFSAYVRESHKRACFRKSLSADFVVISEQKQASRKSTYT